MKVQWWTDWLLVCHVALPSKVGMCSHNFCMMIFVSFSSSRSRDVPGSVSWMDFHFDAIGRCEMSAFYIVVTINSSAYTLLKSVGKYLAGFIPDSAVSTLLLIL
jgi:hypothetical protein